MPKWELAIAVCDEPEAHRKKEGDIIAVKPHPWQWGRREVDEYLIVVVDGLSREEAERLTLPLYADGRDSVPDDLLEPDLEIVAKRKYRIPLEHMKAAAEKSNFSIDLAKVRDKARVYQPLKDEGIALATSIIKAKRVEDAVGLK